MNRIVKTSLLSLSGLSVLAPTVATIACSSDPIDVGVTVWNASDPFMSVVKQGFEKYGDEFDVKFSWNDAEGDQTKNNDKVESLIASGVKALAVNLNDPASGATPINKAKSANLPIILWNKETTTENMALYDKAYYVGAVARQSGEAQIAIIAEEINKGVMKDRDGDGQLEYFIINGEAGHPDALGRTEANRLDLPKELAKSDYQTEVANIPASVVWFKSPEGAAVGKSDPISAIDATDGVWGVDSNTNRIYVKKGATEEQLAAIYQDIDSWENPTDLNNVTDWSSAKGLEVTQAKLAAEGNNLDFIIANNDGTAMGAVAAIKAEGNFVSLATKESTSNFIASKDTNYMPVFGVDNTVDAQASMQQGWLTGTVLQDGIKQGYIVMAMALNAIAGKEGSALLDGVDSSWYKSELDTATKAVRVDYVPIPRSSLDQFK